MNGVLGEYLNVNPRNESRVLKQRLVNEARLLGEPSEGRFTGRFFKAALLRSVLVQRDAVGDLGCLRSGLYKSLEHLPARSGREKVGQLFPQRTHEILPGIRLLRSVIRITFVKERMPGM